MRARSTVASVWPSRASTPPLTARRGNICPAYIQFRLKMEAACHPLAKHVFWDLGFTRHVGWSLWALLV
jgi:hypothetical protein